MYARQHLSTLGHDVIAGLACGEACVWPHRQTAVHRPGGLHRQEEAGRPGEDYEHHQSILTCAVKTTSCFHQFPVCYRRIFSPFVIAFDHSFKRTPLLNF